MSLTPHIDAGSAEWEKDRALVFSKLVDLFELTREIRDALNERQTATDKAIIEIQRNYAVRERDITNLSTTVRRAEAAAEMANERAPEGLADDVSGNTAKLYKHDALLKGLDRVNKGLFWIGGALGVSVIGLIWSLITGQATINFGS